MPGDSVVQRRQSVEDTLQLPDPDATVDLDDTELKKRIVCLKKVGIPFTDIAVFVDKSTNSVQKLNSRWKNRVTCTKDEVDEYLRQANLKWLESGHQAEKERKAKQRKIENRRVREALKRGDTELLKYGGLGIDVVREIICMHDQDIPSEDIAQHFGFEKERISYVLRKYENRVYCEDENPPDEVFSRTPRMNYKPLFLERVVCLYKGGVMTSDLLEYFSLKKSALMSLLRRHSDQFECSRDQIMQLYEEALNIKPDLKLTSHRGGLLIDLENEKNRPEGERSSKRRRTRSASEESEKGEMREAETEIPGDVDEENRANSPHQQSMTTRPQRKQAETQHELRDSLTSPQSEALQIEQRDILLFGIEQETGMALDHLIQSTEFDEINAYLFGE